jgi:hypothetical protein
VDASSVQHKLKIGKAIGALDRVTSQYLVYLDGRSFSSGMLPMIPTGALVGPLLLVITLSSHYLV